jgi:hypothetical protein
MEATPRCTWWGSKFMRLCMRLCPLHLLIPRASQSLTRGRGMSRVLGVADVSPLLHAAAAVTSQVLKRDAVLPLLDMGHQLEGLNPPKATLTSMGSSEY